MNLILLLMEQSGHLVQWILPIIAIAGANARHERTRLIFLELDFIYGWFAIVS